VLGDESEDRFQGSRNENDFVARFAALFHEIEADR
jgi:hypothetical protein